MQRYAIWSSLGQAQGRSKLGKSWVIFKWKRHSNGKNHALYYCTFVTIAVQLSSQCSKPLRTYWACHSISWVTWSKCLAVSDIWKTSYSSCIYAALCVCVWVGGDVVFEFHFLPIFLILFSHTAPMSNFNTLSTIFCLINLWKCDAGRSMIIWKGILSPTKWILVNVHWNVYVQLM